MIDTTIMKKLIFLLFTILLVISCKDSPATTFSKDGVTFTVPSGWEISEEENLDTDGYYLSVEKNGFNASGIVVMTWVVGKQDLRDTYVNYKKNMYNIPVYSNANLQFRNEADTSYGNKSSFSAPFTASVAGMDHEGRLHFITAADKIFTIMIQGAVEDKSENEKGFKTIADSFVVE